MCSAPAFCAWRRLPLNCWKLLIGVCVRDGRRACCFCLRISHFCCFRPSVEELPRGWRTVAFPRWLHVLSCLTWLIVRCCINSYVLASLTLIVIVARSTDHPTLIARLDAGTPRPAGVHHPQMRRTRGSYMTFRTSFASERRDAQNDVTTTIHFPPR